MAVDKSFSTPNGFDTGRWGFGSMTWSGIFAGVATGLGLFIMLMLFGAALGLSVLDPYQITRHETSYGFPMATIAWLTISALASAFVAACIAGCLSFSDREGSLLQGAVVWGLGAILVAFGIASFVEIIPQDATTKNAGVRTMAYTYSSLDDPAFSNFVLDRARDWRPGDPDEQPIEVSAEVKDRVDPDDIPDNDDLHAFVKKNTRLSDKQTEEFLESEKYVIAREQAEAQERWEQRHSAELARMERARKASSAVAWTLTAVAFLSLVAALGGGYFGWYSRSRGMFNRAGYRASNGGANPVNPNDVV